MTEDDQLMVRIQEGEAAAFEELMSRHQRTLIGFFYRQTHDIQLAEDLSQETLLRVYQRSWDYLPTGRFVGWMYRIARNLLIDHVRKRSHDALVRSVSGSQSADENVLASIAGKFLAPEQKATQKELADLVDQLLLELPEEQRLTFLLHHFTGLPLAEVAEVMETNTATCKSRLRLAREKLQDYLTHLGVEHPEA